MKTNILVTNVRSACWQDGSASGSVLMLPGETVASAFARCVAEENFKIAEAERRRDRFIQLTKISGAAGA